MISPDYTEAFACGFEAWSGFWGDPLFSGALMMGTYATAALTALRASRSLRGAERAVWTLAVALLAFQVINTPLDLHALLWASGRCLSHIQGWYTERYAYQRDLLVLLAITACVVTAICILLLRRDLLSNGLLVLGLSLSLSMTVVKGINYHALEALYQFPLGPLWVPDVIELFGVALVLCAAYVKIKRPRQA